MSITKINEAYAQTEIFNVLEYLGIAGLTFIVSLAILAFAFKDSSFSSSSVSSMATLTTIFVTLIVILITTPIQEEKRVEWKEKVEEDHIEKLDVQKVDLTEYFKVSETTLDSHATFFTKKVKDTGFFKLFWVEDGIPVENNLEVEIKRVADLEKPYLEYQYLKQTLPVKEVIGSQFGPNISLEKGYYNAVLYIPENYK